MDLEELELALEKLDLEILEEKNEIILESASFDQNGILIIDNKYEHNHEQVTEWSVE